MYAFLYAFLFASFECIHEFMYTFVLCNAFDVKLRLETYWASGNLIIILYDGNLSRACPKC